jgi:hypothetical protein
MRRSDETGRLEGQRALTVESSKVTAYDSQLKSSHERFVTDDPLAEQLAPGGDACENIDSLVDRKQRSSVSGSPSNDKSEHAYLIYRFFLARVQVSQKSVCLVSD